MLIAKMLLALGEREAAENSHRNYSTSAQPSGTCI